MRRGKKVSALAKMKGRSPHLPPHTHTYASYEKGRPIEQTNGTIRF